MYSISTEKETHLKLETAAYCHSILVPIGEDASYHIQFFRVVFQTEHLIPTKNPPEKHNECVISVLRWRVLAGCCQPTL